MRYASLVAAVVLLVTSTLAVYPGISRCRDAAKAADWSGPVCYSIFFMIFGKALIDIFVIR